jgi:serine/threonine protein kinase
MRRWDPCRFQFVSKLQDATTNRGVVNLMRSLEHGLVAVKRMPRSWTCSGPREFDLRHPSSEEQPWHDLSILAFLNQIEFPFACALHGVFHDNKATYVVSSFATEGDLFAWIEQAKDVGSRYEAEMRPIALEIFLAVRLLHDLGIAHRDLSIENILLTKVTGKLVAKLIDFGASTVARNCRPGEVRGKKAYQAPEMHLGAYGSFEADNFALGVVLLVLAGQDYPWKSTEPGNCAHYGFFRKRGFKAFLKASRSRKAPGSRLADLISSGLVDTIAGLLQEQPAWRMNIGESCWKSHGLTSFWDMVWTQDLYGACCQSECVPVSGG